VRDGREIVRCDLRGRLQRGFEDSPLVERGAEGFARVVQDRVLALGALQLHEQTLVLERS
jgi:hypothetical protein